MSKQEQSTLVRGEMESFQSESYKWKVYRLNKWQSFGLKILYVLASVFGGSAVAAIFL